MNERGKNVALLLAALLLAVFWPAAAHADQVDDAVQAYARGEMERTRALTDAYLQQPLGKPAARVALAAYYRGVAADSVADRERYLLQAGASHELDPELRAGALIHLMRLALLRGEFQRAALWGERILNDFSATAAAADAAYYAAVSYARNGNAARALELLRELGRRSPPPVGLDRAEAAIASILFQERRHAEAVTALLNMLVGYPETSYKCWIYFSLGENYRLLGEAGQAAAAYRQVGEIFPDGFEAPAARAALAELAAAENGTPGPAPGAVMPDIRPLPPAAAEQPPAGGGWTVQVAAFTGPGEAQTLAQQLHGQGVAPVDIRRAQVNGTWWYRVRAGRLATRAAAEQFRADLQRRGFSGFVANW